MLHIYIVMLGAFLGGVLGTLVNPYLTARRTNAEAKAQELVKALNDDRAMYNEGWVAAEKHHGIKRRV